MDPLPERIAAVVAILQESADAIEESRLAEGTGFVAFDVRQLADAVLALHTARPPPGRVIDLGCGNGLFAILAATAGYTAYGIELDPRLVEEAQYLHDACVARGLIDPATVCRFATGNFFPPSVKEEFLRFREQYGDYEDMMPWQDTADPYAALGVSLREMDALYTWAWPTQSRFLFNFLEENTRADTVFLLPAYERYTERKTQNKLLLERIAVVDGRTPLFIGRRATGQ